MEPRESARRARRASLGALLLSTVLTFLLAGCNPVPCDFDEDCPVGQICQGSSVCPPDMVCIWKGEPGVCVGANPALCEATGGRWDPNSCGHYECGNVPACRAIIPGCDCGPLSNFVRGQGCVPDDECPGTGCDSDADCPATFHCADYLGSVVAFCRSSHCEVAPGIPAGPEPIIECPREFECVAGDVHGICQLSDEFYCGNTGGQWSWDCGNWECGRVPPCLALIPGCNCGPWANFVSGKGCVLDRACFDEL